MGEEFVEIEDEAEDEFVNKGLVDIWEELAEIEGELVSIETELLSSLDGAFVGLVEELVSLKSLLLTPLS
jgi:hypothetical protein